MSQAEDTPFRPTALLRSIPTVPQPFAVLNFLEKPCKRSLSVALQSTNPLFEFRVFTVL